MVTNSFPVGYFSIPGMKFTEEIIISKKIDHHSVFFHACEYFKIKEKDITIRSRKRKHLYPRQVCIYLLCKYSNYSLIQIAELFPSNSKIGHIDHSSVINSRETLIDLMDTEDSVKEDIRIMTELVMYGMKSKTIKETYNEI